MVKYVLNYNLGYFSDQDDEFVLRDTMVDVDDEMTLEEEEKLEDKEDHAEEISQLEEEGITSKEAVRFKIVHPMGLWWPICP